MVSTKSLPCWTLISLNRPFWGGVFNDVDQHPYGCFSKCSAPKQLACPWKCLQHYITLPITWMITWVRCPPISPNFRTPHDSSIPCGFCHLTNCFPLFPVKINQHLPQKSGVGTCPFFSHHPTIGDISSPTNTCFSDVNQIPVKQDIFTKPYIGWIFIKTTILLVKPPLNHH